MLTATIFAAPSLVGLGAGDGGAAMRLTALQNLTAFAQWVAGINVGWVSRYASTAKDTYGPVSTDDQQKMNAWALYWGEAKRLTGSDASFPLQAEARQRSWVLNRIDEMVSALEKRSAVPTIPPTPPAMSTQAKVGIAAAAVGGLLLLGTVVALAAKGKSSSTV